MHNNQVTMQLNDPKYKADQEEEKFEYKSKWGRRKLAENAIVNDKKIKKKTNLYIFFLKDQCVTIHFLFNKKWIFFKNQLMCYVTKIVYVL